MGICRGILCAVEMKTIPLVVFDGRQFQSWKRVRMRERVSDNVVPMICKLCRYQCQMGLFT